MTKLVTEPNLSDRDGFYAALLEAHSGLDEKQSQELNSRLILILSNHLGDVDLLREALDLAQKTR